MPANDTTPMGSTTVAGSPAGARRQIQRRLVAAIAVGTLAVVGVLFVLFTQEDSGGGTGDSAGGGPRFDVGEPGPGEAAPAFELPSSDGGTWALTDEPGRSVLLYFQEGLMCQACWDQITAVEDRWDDFAALGVDELVSISNDPQHLSAQKVADDGITTPVLADENLSLADDYTANQYGMMGTSHYGHSFILVDPDGTIRWRADYGGKPDYTMFVDVDDLLDDLKAAQQT